MIRAIFKNYISENEGASAVEFALLAPFFIIVLVATFDFGVYIQERMKIQSTAHTVAEYISVSQSEEGAQTVANEAYSGRNESIDVDTSFSCECGDGVVAECPIVCEEEDDFQRRFVTVSVSGQFDALFPYPGVPETINMSTAVRMRVD